jgi:hypothetical protein
LSSESSGAGKETPIDSFEKRFGWVLTGALWLAPVCAHGQEKCREEVKLLLSPAQVQVAVAALGAHPETHSDIYFYDTSDLDLLAKGVVLRLRAGKEIDLTAKLRPVEGERFADPTGGAERYKCEADLNDGVEAQSFSVQKRHVSAKVPATGEELRRLLSDGQRKLLEDSTIRIDWKRVQRLAEIRSTSWVTGAKGSLGKLSLELWEWPGGRVLELSARVAPDAGQASYAKLQELAKKNGLTVSKEQRPKTTTVLRQAAAAKGN